MRLLPIVAVFTALAVVASVSAAGLNPPPAAALGGYRSYELKPLQVSDELKSTETGQKATAKIQEHIDARLKPVVEGWNKMAEGEANGKTLVFEPSVADLRFINGTKRFWAGALAGKSHVVMHVKVIEQPGDKVLPSLSSISTPAAWRAHGPWVHTTTACCCASSSWRTNTCRQTIRARSAGVPGVRKKTRARSNSPATARRR